jgi:hypothetical protein
MPRGRRRAGASHEHVHLRAALKRRGNRVQRGRLDRCAVVFRNDEYAHVLILK